MKNTDSSPISPSICAEVLSLAPQSAKQCQAPFTIKVSECTAKELWCRGRLLPARLKLKTEVEVEVGR